MGKGVLFVVRQCLVPECCTIPEKERDSRLVCSSFICRYDRQFFMKTIHRSAFSVDNPLKYSGAKLSVARCCGGGGDGSPSSCMLAAVCSVVVVVCCNGCCLGLRTDGISVCLYVGAP